MSQNRFMAINSALRYTKKPAPTEFVDEFHDVRELINAFNEHYSDEYLPSWLNCLDESMNTWLNNLHLVICVCLINLILLVMNTTPLQMVMMGNQ